MQNFESHSDGFGFDVDPVLTGDWISLGKVGQEETSVLNGKMFEINRRAC